MPKIITDPNVYMLRISYSPNMKKDVNLEKLFKDYDSYIEQDEKVQSCLGVEHSGKDGKNLHRHYVIVATVSQPTLREVIKKFFVAKSYSCKKVIKNDDELYSYLFHERDDCIKFNKGVCQEDIQRFQELNREIQEDKRDGGSKYKLVNEVIKMYNEMDYIKYRCWNRHKKIAKCIYDYYSEGWFPSKFQMERYIMTIERQMDKNNGTEEEGFEALYQKFFC